MRTKIRLLTLLVLMFAGTTLFAQDKAISGVVKDNTGAELSGATVSVKGTSNSVMTDAKGKFTIKAGAKATIVVSFVGFQSKEAAVNGQSTINFTLEPGTSALNDVVVTSLGISKKQKALGYAVSTVSAEQITDAGTPNFATALYGKAPGVRIAATPGGATSAVNINIRGINSITGKNDPLIVMDGIPIRNGEVRNNDYWSDQRLRGNGLLDIQTEDIENISILKGASAAALYGSEAVNGVVLITTKQASKNRKGLGVDVSTNYSIDNVAFLPKYQNVRGYGISNTINNSAGQDDNGFVWWDLNGDGIKETRSLGSFSINYGPKFDGQPILNWDGRIIPYSAQPNNYDALFQTAHNSSVNVAVSKASENANIRFSLTRQENEGVSMGSKSEKNSMNLNTSFKLSPKFSTDVTITYVNQTIKNRPYSIDRMINNFTGMIGIFDNGQWYQDKVLTSQGYRYVQGVTGQSTTPSENIIYTNFRGDIADYMYRVIANTSDETSNRLISSVTNTWQISNHLKFRSRISTDFTNMKTENRTRNEKPLVFGYSGGFGMSNYSNIINYTDALLTYTNKIGQDIEVNATGGYTASKETSTTLSRSTSGGLSTENLFDIAASVNTATSGSSRSSLVKDAFIGTLNGSYKNYLFAEATLRRDRTSTMNPNNNSFIYPSVNSSFIFSDAFEMPSWLTYGKLRASWGVVGNYPGMYIANVAYNQGTLGVQTGANPALFTQIPTGSFGNDRIRPEEKHEVEFGLETRLFKNRFGIDLSYYNAQIVDQILGLTLPAASGASSILTNIGTLRDKGIELSINGTIIQNKNFKWESTINMAKNANKVEKLATGLTRLLHADY